MRFPLKIDIWCIFAESKMQILFYSSNIQQMNINKCFLNDLEKAAVSAGGVILQSLHIQILSMLFIFVLSHASCE